MDRFQPYYPERYETFAGPDESMESHLRDEGDSPDNLVDEERAHCDGLLSVCANAESVHDLTLALRAHYAECVHCGSGKKTVVSDRLMLGTPGSGCCGEVA